MLKRNVYEDGWGAKNINQLKKNFNMHKKKNLQEERTRAFKTHHQKNRCHKKIWCQIIIFLNLIFFYYPKFH